MREADVQTSLSLNVKEEMQSDIDGLPHFSVPSAGVNTNRKWVHEGVSFSEEPPRG